MSKVSRYAPNEAYDLPSEVTAGKKLTLSHGYMQFKTLSDGIIYPYQTLICKFSNILNPFIVDYTMTDDELATYYQSPKLLSMDLYGTPELWSGLLYINNMVSVANFTNKRIKVFKVGIIEVLEELMTIYHDDLLANRNTVYLEEPVQ